MFTDPMSTAKYVNVLDAPVLSAMVNFPRVSSGTDSSVYSNVEATAGQTLRIDHAYGRRTRHAIRLDSYKIDADTWNPAQNAKYTMSCYVVVDVPVAGFTILEQSDYLSTLGSVFMRTANTESHTGEDGSTGPAYLRDIGFDFLQGQS